MPRTDITPTSNDELKRVLHYQDPGVLTVECFSGGALCTGLDPKCWNSSIARGHTTKRTRVAVGLTSTTFRDLTAERRRNIKCNLRGHKNVRNVTKERAKEKTSKTSKELPQNEEEIKCNQRIRDLSSQSCALIWQKSLDILSPFLIPCPLFPRKRHSALASVFLPILIQFSSCLSNLNLLS